MWIHPRHVAMRFDIMESTSFRRDTRLHGGKHRQRRPTGRRAGHPKEVDPGLARYAVLTTAKPPKPWRNPWVGTAVSLSGGEPHAGRALKQLGKQVPQLVKEAPQLTAQSSASEDPKLSIEFMACSGIVLESRVPPMPREAGSSIERQTSRQQT